jgi:hypothetical protein
MILKKKEIHKPSERSSVLKQENAGAIKTVRFVVWPSSTGTPVRALAAEHGRELLGDALEYLLDASVVAREGGRNLQALRRDVADRALDVVRDPLDEVLGNRCGALWLRRSSSFLRVVLRE